MKNKIVIVTGGFDPLHSGHINYFEAAKQLGDLLVVGVNSDEWLTRKKGRPFMTWADRAQIIKSLRCVDLVAKYDDSDGSSKLVISTVRDQFPDAHIIFANGGDRTAKNIPEMDFQDPDLEFVFGVGGENKLNSSSDILSNWRTQKVERPWGYYTVIDEVPGAKVKTLNVMPGQTLSMQRHEHRSEYWMVTSGMCLVNLALPGDVSNPPKLLNKYDELKIHVGAWHQLTNPFTKPCTIVEIQYGELCDENDIERYSPK